MALALLVIGGDAALGALQSTAIAIALPFSLVMIAMIFALVRSLNAEYRVLEEQRHLAHTHAVAHHVQANLAADEEGHKITVRKDRTPMGVTPGLGPEREHG